MKKLVAIFFAVIIAVSISSCGKKEIIKDHDITENKTVRIEKPMVETNEKRINEKSGIELNLPEKATGVTYYMINDEIGQVSFDLDKLNYTLRAKKAEASDDFSGLYYEWTDNKKVKVNDNEAQAHIYDSEDKSCGSLIWFDKDNKTALTLSVEGKTTPEKLVKIAETIIK